MVVKFSPSLASPGDLGLQLFKCVLALFGEFLGIAIFRFFGFPLSMGLAEALPPSDSSLFIF